MATGRLIARNSALNLVGQALPVLAALIAIPPLLRGLGEERFGVLTLAWATIGYFSLFELGLGKALTQAVAQRLGNGNGADLPTLSWSALLMLGAFGLVGAVALVAITPWLTTSVLRVPPALQRETALSFWILAAALPFVLTTVGLRALMEAHQHFGVATLLRAPLGAFSFIGPLLVLPFSKSLVAATAMLAVGRVIGLALHALVAARIYPFLGYPIRLSRDAARMLLHFGGWSTVSNIVSPMMVYLDRFVIGGILTVAAVAHYVTPYEVVVRILIIPVSLASVVLPAFAATYQTNPTRAADLYDKALRGMMLATFPATFAAVVLAHEGLSLWTGSALPPESALVLQWLAAGVFVTALAQAPLTALQAVGRPDLIAKLHLAELPFYVVSLIALARSWGLPGVAMAWTLRATVDALAMFWIARLRVGVSVVPRVGGVWPLLIMGILMAAGAAIDATNVRVVFVVAVAFCFAPIGWLVLLTPRERDALAVWLRAPLSRHATLEESI